MLLILSKTAKTFSHTRSGLIHTRSGLIRTSSRLIRTSSRLIRTSSRLLAVLTLAWLSACASTPPAAEVCSADWIKPRTDAALNEFKRSSDDIWQRLRKSGERAADKGNIGLIEKASVLLSLSRLVSSFQDSQALEDLQTLGRTCDDPDLVRNALLGTLEEYNVPEPYINLLNELEGFMQLMNNSADGALNTN